MEELDQNGFNGFTTAIEYHYSVRPELGEQGEGFGSHNKILPIQSPLLLYALLTTTIPPSISLENHVIHSQNPPPPPSNCICLVAVEL